MELSGTQSRELRQICERWFVKRLALFGSRIRGDSGTHSDLDVLVEFREGSAPGFFALADFTEELSNVFGGLKLDVRTPKDLSRHFRDDVVTSAHTLYAT